MALPLPFWKSHVIIGNMSETELDFLCETVPSVSPTPTRLDQEPETVVLIHSNSQFFIKPGSSVCALLKSFTDRKNVCHTLYKYNKIYNNLYCKFHWAYWFLQNAIIDFYWPLVTINILDATVMGRNMFLWYCEERNFLSPAREDGVPWWTSLMM